MIEKTFDVTGTPEVSIRIQSGRIDLVEGNTGVVKVRVSTRDPDFVVERRGDLIDIHTSEEGGWVGSSSAEVWVELPAGSNVVARSASADVDTTVDLGKLEVKTASGDVSMQGADKVIIKTASGDTTIGAVGSALRFNSASGDLVVRDEIHGSLVATTASGDLHLIDTDAILEISTVSGDALIDRFHGRSAAVKTMSGSVEIGIPTGTRLDLDVSLLSGKLRLPPNTTETGPTGRQMSLKVKTVSGDLTLNRLPA